MDAALDLTSFADGLVRGPDGAWRGGSSRPVSFPEDGHRLHAEVEDGSFWFRERNRAICDLVRAHPPAGPIFDIGGGTGFVAAGLREAGFDVVVVEPGDEGVEHALGRGLTVVHAEAREAGLRAGSLPAAGLFDVIEHVEDDGALLRWLVERLRPGGWLYLTAPARPLLWSAEDERLGHRRRYTRAALAGALRAAGLEVVHVGGLFLPLVPGVFALRTLPSLLGFRGRTARRYGQEHRGGGLAGALAPLFAWERRRLRGGAWTPTGTSLIAAARRPG